MRGTITALDLDERCVTITSDDGSTYRADFSALPGHVYPELRTPVGMFVEFALSSRDLKCRVVSTIAGIRG